MKLTPIVLVCGSMVVAAAAGTTLVALAPYGEAPALVGESVSGSIETVDLTSQVFSLRVEEQPQPMQFMVNEKTTYTLDGAAAEAEKALQVGNNATVSYKEADLTASKVDATTPE